MAGEPTTTILNTRHFDAPRERVFGAFTDPDQLALWFGPDGFTNTVKSFDLRPGGHWHVVMHGPNGTDYPNDWAFVDIVEPERVVTRHLGPVHVFDLELTYAERDGGTELTWRQTFEKPIDNENLMAFLQQANEQNLNKLAAHLAASA